MNTKTLLLIVAALAASAGGCVAQVGPDDGTASSTTSERLGTAPTVDQKDNEKTAAPNNVVDPGGDVMDGEQEGPWPVPWKGAMGSGDPWHPTPDPGPQEPQAQRK